MYVLMNSRFRERRGMSTALAVVVSIIVLLVVAMAVIGVTTGSISQLAEKVKQVIGSANATDVACSSYHSQLTCEANRMCKWENGRCVPV